MNIKTDKEVKEKAQKLAGDLGLSLSAIVNAYLRQLVREEEIYFSAASKMTPRLEALVEEARQDFVKKKNISPLFSSAKAAIKYLHF